MKGASTAGDLCEGGFDPEMQGQTLVVRAEMIGPRYY